MTIKKITESSVSRLSINECIRDPELIGFRAERKKTGIFFYLRYQLSGKRNTVKVGTHGLMTATQARNKAKEIAGEVAKGNDPVQTKKQERSDAIKKGQQTLRAFLHKGYLEVTEDKTAADVLPRVSRQFRELLDRPMSDITPWWLEKWKQAFTGKASSCNREMTALQGVLSKAVKAGLIDENPLSKVKKLREDKSKKIRFLTNDEEDRLYAALDERQQAMKQKRDRKIQWCKERRKEPPPPLDEEFTDYLKPMIIIALLTGLRRGELFNLKVCDIDFPDKVLTVVGEGAKSGQTRHIPLNERAFNTITSWIEQSQPSSLIFPSPKTGNRLDNIDSSWEALREQARII